MVFLLALTLECTIEGLVTDAEFRSWVFHAIAAATAGAALYRRTVVAVVATGSVSLVAFLSDLEMLISNDAPLRFVLPSLLLVAGAGILLYGFVQGSQRSNVAGPVRSPVSTRTRGVAGKVVDAAGAVAFVPNIRQELRESKDDPAWTPFLLIGGVLAIGYCMISAKWIRVDALFGLTSRSLDFNDLRDVYDSIGVKYFARNFYFEWGFMLPYLAALLGSITVLGWLTKQFRITPPMLYVVLAAEAVALLIHSAVVLGINDATDEPQLLAGPWIGSLGIAAIIAGTWLAETRS